tara:strand:+ start:535 stop:702 length:168 start_codon:yes stop_codon:yes gene_type:complete
MTQELQQERDQYEGFTREEYLDIYTVACHQCGEDIDEEGVLENSDICIDCFDPNN